MIKRPDGRWYERVNLPGMEKPKYFYGKTQKEVRQKVAEFKADQVEGVLFEAAVDAWSDWHEKQVSYNGHESYRSAIAEVKEQWEGKRVSDIGADEIDAFLRHLAGRGYARRTVQMRRDLLNMVYDYAIVKRWAETNPVKAVRMPKGLSKGTRELPTDEQIEKVRAGVTLDFGLFPAMLLYTGLRRGELLALTWDDVDRENGVIHVTKAVYYTGNVPAIKEPKTEAGRRDVVLLDALAEILPESGKGYIFGGDAPLHKGNVRQRWVTWCREAGLATAHKDKPHRSQTNNRTYQATRWEPDVTPHQLRHAFATICYDAGLAPKDAQNLLGHSSVKITQDIYTHISNSRRERTADKLNSFLRQK